MVNMRGFSLIELLVVIALIAILLSIATINFNSWSRKYAIEGQVKELHADVTAVRLRAIQTKLRHRITLNPTTMVVRSFASEADAVGTPIPEFNKTLKYQIQQLDGGGLSAFSNTQIIFNEQGYVPDLGWSIAVGVGQGDAALNCLSVQVARVNIGRINGNNCDPQ
jgi:type IV fimbrial biogenesis protein FimT